MYPFRAHDWNESLNEMRLYYIYIKNYIKNIKYFIYIKYYIEYSIEYRKFLQIIYQKMLNHSILRENYSKNYLT